MFKIKETTINFFVLHFSGIVSFPNALHKKNATEMVEELIDEVSTSNVTEASIEEEEEKVTINEEVTVEVTTESNYHEHELENVNVEILDIDEIGTSTTTESWFWPDEVGQVDDQNGFWDWDSETEAETESQNEALFGDFNDSREKEINQRSDEEVLVEDFVEDASNADLQGSSKIQ